MRRILLALVLVVAFLPTGCGAGEPGADGETPPTNPPASSPADLYEADATVLDDADGPKLCLGGVAESLPPQCAGLPLLGWDWRAVEGEETVAGTTWGDYRLVGTFDGEAFTVREAGPSEPDPGELGSERDFTTPCPEPDGGWVAADPSRVSEEAFDAGASAAQARPDFVALWVDYVGGDTSEELARRLMDGESVLKIMNVVVTDDVTGAEAAIRETWGGPLCVIQREGHTEQELAAIRDEAERFVQEDLGLRFTWSSDGDVGLAAEIGVVVDPGGAGQAALDERYGPGMVQLFPALTPVAG
jgi:hypothetical protein